MTIKLIRNSLWLSILLHLLLLLSMLAAMFLAPDEDKPEKSPHLFVPSYMYTGSIKPMPMQKNQTGSQNEPSTDNAKTPVSEPEAESSPGIENLEKTDDSTGILQAQKKPPARQQSMLAISMNMLKQNQLNEVSKTRSEDPIYLVGDDNNPADPLVKLLGRALSAHFSYPRTAGEFGIRGRVIVELVLHPGGYFTDVQMLRSSGNQDLDAAALYAANSAPEIIGANRYIDKPKHFVVGFVFN